MKTSHCVGCGYCCKKTPCILGVRVYGPKAPCGGLIFKDGRYWCEQVLNAKGRELQELREGLAIGAGCCSSLCNSDREKMLRSSSCSRSAEP